MVRLDILMMYYRLMMSYMLLEESSSNVFLGPLPDTVTEKNNWQKEEKKSIRSLNLGGLAQNVMYAWPEGTIYQDLFIYITIYSSISRFIYKNQNLNKISLHQDPYTARLWQAYKRYLVKLVCLITEPCKIAHVIPNLKQFLKAFLKGPYTRSNGRN